MNDNDNEFSKETFKSKKKAVPFPLNSESIQQSSQGSTELSFKNGPYADF